MRPLTRSAPKALGNSLARALPRSTMSMEVVMKQLFLDAMVVFALLVLPFAGCSSSTNGNGGNGGDGGSGGTDGSGGAGGGAGSGGAAGIGGMAGNGGAGGNGTATQSWSGQGTGEDGPFTICLTVNEDGNTLVFDGDGTCSWSFAVQFESCATRPDAWATAQDIPIVEGSFSFSSSRGEISGAFAGDTVSGDVRVAQCNGSWTVRPDP